MRRACMFVFSVLLLFPNGFKSPQSKPDDEKQTAQEPKKPFSITEEPLPKHLGNRDRETVETGIILFHKNVNPKLLEKTIVGVSVTDTLGRTVASLLRGVGARYDGIEWLLLLKVEPGYDWEGANGAKCKVSIRNPAGVKRNEHWSFDYEIELISSDMNMLKCSDSRIDLYSAPNKKSSECVLKLD